MKAFNEKNEAVLSISVSPMTTGKQGELTEHAQYVQTIEFYHPIGLCKFTKVVIRKEMIFDLIKQIHEIEGTTVMLPLADELPF